MLGGESWFTSQQFLDGIGGIRQLSASLAQNAPGDCITGGFLTPHVFRCKLLSGLGGLDGKRQIVQFTLRLGKLRVCIGQAGGAWLRAIHPEPRTAGRPGEEHGTPPALWLAAGQ